MNIPDNLNASAVVKMLMQISRLDEVHEVGKEEVDSLHDVGESRPALYRSSHNE